MTFTLIGRLFESCSYRVGHFHNFLSLLLDLTLKDHSYLPANIFFSKLTTLRSYWSLVFDIKSTGLFFFNGDSRMNLVFYLEKSLIFHVGGGLFGFKIIAN